jgi:hypothetical protein
MTSGPVPSFQHFANTRWSMVVQLDAGLARDARSALIELCLRYWYPVYAYLRRCGHAPAIAQHLAGSFLQHLFRGFQGGAELRRHGQFRRYLLERLTAFLASDRSEPDNDQTIAELTAPPTDLEQRNLRDNDGTQSSEQVYQRSFALEVLSRAFARLRNEARENGHLDMYETLEPYLAIEPAATEYEELTQRLGMRPLALTVALKRLRQRWRELIDGELVDTVASADELVAERAALHAALSDGIEQ